MQRKNAKLKEINRVQRLWWNKQNAKNGKCLKICNVLSIIFSALLLFFPLCLAFAVLQTEKLFIVHYFVPKMALKKREKWKIVYFFLQ